MPLNLYSEPLHWLQRLLRTGSRYRTPGQRPYDVYLPHLTAQPFHPTTASGKSLEQNWQAIFDEYQQVCEDQGPPPNYAHVAAGSWGTFDMISQGKPNPALAARCPATITTVNQLPLVDMVTFSTLAPGTHLKPHYGPTNVKLRHQLCIENAEGARIRVGDQWRSWQAGKCLVIDDSYDHEVVHEGDRRRVVMLVDCWHPDLSPKQQAFLERLYAIWDSKAN